MIGTVQSIKKLEKTEQLLIECNSKSVSDRILKLSDFAGIPTQTKPHPSLNSSKGVIRCPDLKGVSEQEILRELTPQEVCGVRRITRPGDIARIPTNTIVLTFSTPHLPKSIKVGYLKVKVEVYVPNPLRCYHCQKFGHHEEQCKAEYRRCAKCGVESSVSQHKPEQCPGPAKCCNCGGEHETTSKTCPTWKKEKEILKVKYTENVSFPEARKIVNGRHSNPSELNYANALRTSSTSTTVDSSTQDDPEINPDEGKYGKGLKIVLPSNYKSPPDSNTKPTSTPQPTPKPTPTPSRKEPPTKRKPLSRGTSPGDRSAQRNPLKRDQSSRGSSPETGRSPQRKEKKKHLRDLGASSNIYMHLMDTDDPSGDAPTPATPISPIKHPN